MGSQGRQVSPGNRKDNGCGAVPQRTDQVGGGQPPLAGNAVRNVQVCCRQGAEGGRVNVPWRLPTGAAKDGP